jgi:outer membrane protein assembly factor BamA
MARRSPMRVVPLSVLLTFFSGQVLLAQPQQEKPQTCSPSCLSADEFKEMVGEKVYPKIIIDDVKFDGSSRLLDSNAEQAIITELKHHEFDGGSHWLDEILEVPVRNAWEKQGYFKVIVHGQTQVMSADSTYEHVVITIRINQGLKYWLGGDIQFREADRDEPDKLVFSREELRKLIPLQEGDIFSTEKIREGIDAVKKLYGSHGYLNFVATPVTEVDDATQRISLVMELDEGKQFRVGKVEVIGLDSQAEGGLRWRLHQGDIFNNELFEDFLADNENALPNCISPSNVELRKSEKKATVEIRIVIPACP